MRTNLLELDAPALLQHLEESGVSVVRVSKTRLDWSRGRELTPEETKAPEGRRCSLLDVLAARNLLYVNRYGSDVVPALRAFILDSGEANRNPDSVARELHSRGYLGRLADGEEIRTALEVLDIEDRRFAVDEDN